MAYISSKCTYCTNEKQITADKTTWMIHLAGHRDRIISHLTDTTKSCVFCSYSETFADKKHAALYYRWGHQKSTIISWALQSLPMVMMITTS